MAVRYDASERPAEHSQLPPHMLSGEPQRSACRTEDHPPVEGGQRTTGAEAVHRERNQSSLCPDSENLSGGEGRSSGKFTIGKKNYLLTRNDGRNTLHGGTRGLGKRVWAARQASTRSKQTLQLTYLSRDGEEGFPGNLSVIATFSVPVGRNELCIDYTATTDKNTVLNLTNHSYFNLGGTGKGDVLTHRLRICGQQFTPIDTEMIPTGEFRNVVGTPFDFIQPTAIGEHIHADNEQLKYGKGYDHNWVLDSKPANAFDLAAEIHEPESGRMLSIFTTEPGIQFYAGNFLDGSIQGKGGKVYKHRSAFCLETQHFPDSPNHPEFPPTVLEPGRAFHSGTVYRFSLRQQP